MPRYPYDKLVVSCRKSIEFGPGEMRAAVECLKQIPDERPERSWIGLIAEVTVPAGNYKLRAKPFLKLSQIIGKTPPEVWAMFDKIVEQDIEWLVWRG